MSHYEDLCDIQEALIRAVRSEVGNIRNANTRELGEAVDMIKDLAEACYYESRSEEGMRLGYSGGRRGYSDGYGYSGGNSGNYRRGYSSREMMDEMREMARGGDKAEKDRMREELQALLKEL